MSQGALEGEHITFEAGCKHDAAELTALARSSMPGMTFLHELNGWREHYRFGVGRFPADNYLIVGRNPAGKLLSFIWVDAALRLDSQIEEPWWCVNALAVSERYAGHGIGRAMVAALKAQAVAVGVVSVYGVCYPDSAGFWSKQGFKVTPAGGTIAPDKQVRHGSRGLVTLSPFGDVDGDHMFVLSVKADRAGGAARLLVHDS